MPDFQLSNQPFDIAFHPSQPLLYTSLLTGEIKAFRYNESGASSSSSSTSAVEEPPTSIRQQAKVEDEDEDGGEVEPGTMFAGWSVRPTKRCMRGVVVDPTGTKVWGCGKGGGIHAIDALSGKPTEDRLDAHSGPINRIAWCFGDLFVTGGDDGLVKLWDSRSQTAIREYPHHWEYISDFDFQEDKRQLLTTSGDGTLSVIDVRANSVQPMAVSEDQEDELLSLCTIKGGQKVVVGSQLGIVSVWERQKGWADSVDRIPGHPSSVETVVALTPDIIATGSEDSMIRVMQIHPNKFLGVIASHGEFPIERMKLDRNARFLGSVSHDEMVKLTDVQDLFEESDDEDGEGESGDHDDDDAATEMGGKDFDEDMDEDENEEDSDSEDEGEDGKVDADGDTAMESGEDSDAQEEAREARRAKKAEKRASKVAERKKMKELGKGAAAEEVLIGKAKKQQQESKDGGFFDDL